MSRINVHSYPSSIEWESRILKITNSISQTQLVDKVVIVGCWEPGLKEFEKLDDRREIWRIKLKKNQREKGKITRTVQVLEWQIKLFRKMKRENVVMFNCHNLASLPTGVAFKLLKKSKLIYDTHEVETEREWPLLVKWFGKLTELMMIKFVDLTVVVSEATSGWYKKKYGIKNVCVALNFPNRYEASGRSQPILRDTFEISEDNLLFIYQGLLAEGRCIELILEVFSKCTTDRHIVFMGFGEMEDEVKSYGKRYPNIHFHPAVKPEEVLRYTMGADVGIHMLSPSNLNQRITIGNKPFEYLTCGLPCIESNFTEMAKYIEEYDCGWNVSSNAELILALVEKLTRGEIEAKSRNALSCREKFTWEAEEKKMLTAYRRILD